MRTNHRRRISICQFSTFKWTLHEDVARYRSHGFDSIGIWRRKLEEEDCENAIDILYENKMSVSSVHWAGGFTGDGLSFADAIDDAIESIEFASRVAADCLIVHPGSRNGHTTSHASRLFQSALDELLPVASDYGVQLALEPALGPKSNSWTFLDTFQQTLDLLKSYPTQFLGLTLDLHQVGFDSEIFESMDSFGNRISLVQLADRNRNPKDQSRLGLGEGDLAIEKWLEKLVEVGYEGMFEVEVHGQAVQGQDYFSFLDQTFDYFCLPEIESLTSTGSRKSEAAKDQVSGIRIERPRF